ncbi:MAG: efflux RND transporter periplasmic adaptor subunit [Gammaproteobacteria bacterium]|nr:efflux RND transporter periplasmic adaptor subunit [Gammaproteobacteria bacterium]
MRLAMLVATACAAALISACSGDAAPAAPGPRPVGIAAVTSGPALPPVITSGVITPRDQLRLSFKVAGVVDRIRVREGDRVRRGQELATLELAEIDAEVEQAQRLAEKAERDRVRGDELRAARLISEGDAERLRTDAQVAAARLSAARFNRAYAVITSPRDGVVLRRRAEERQVLGAGQDVLVIGPADGGFVVRAGLADRDVVKLRAGDVARVMLDAFPGTALVGSVTEIPGAASEETGLFDVEISLESTKLALVGGLLAKVSIEPGAARGNRLAYVPIGAIIEAERERATVFVPAGGVAQRRELVVAFITPDAVAVRSGIAAGEPVITDGALYLSEGQPIAQATVR